MPGVELLFKQDLVFLRSVPQCSGSSKGGLLPNSVELVNNISLIQRQYHKLLSVDTVIRIYFQARFILSVQLAVK